MTISSCHELIFFLYIHRSGLSLGASKHWSEILEILTGSEKASAEPLLEYFDPLYKFLKNENEKNENPDGVTVGDVEQVNMLVIVFHKGSHSNNTSFSSRNDSDGDNSGEVGIDDVST